MGNPLSTMNQREKVLYYLANGNVVTRVSAMVNLGIQNITSRITELRWDYGVRIVTTVVRLANGTRYARYSLDPAEVIRLRNLGYLRTRTTGGDQLYPNLRLAV